MTKSWLRRHWRLVAFVLLLVAAGVGYRASGLKELLAPGALELFRARILALGLPGALAFTAAYIIIVTFGLPNLPFQLAAGAVYGTWRAFGLMYAGVNLGALTAFFLARTMGRASVEELLGARLQGLNSTIEKGGFRFLLTLRLIPLMPFNAINYASGLSRLKIRDYLAANVLGMFPLTLLHVMFGDAAGSLDLSNPRSWLDPKVIISLGGALTALAIAVIYHLRHRRHTKRAKLEGGRR